VPVSDYSVARFQAVSLDIKKRRTSMKQYAFDADALLSSFRSAGGWYHEDKFRLDRYTGMGYGGKAKVDIPVGISSLSSPM